MTKVFKATSHIHGGSSVFDEYNSPKWLNNDEAVKGSTMDNTWFWIEHVLTLAKGEKVESNFNTIERLE